MGLGLAETSSLGQNGRSGGHLGRATIEVGNGVRAFLAKVLSKFAVPPGR